ncbi:hypothetical protein ACRYJJ_08170 [Cylindrospermopsis raciborskii G7]|uniref:hypothetical protein n=1 Tax=Cylindrospermopsis raciborskii TaxID=77022 RepID=UPI003EC1174C
MSRIRANYDEPWKEALTEYFEQFLLFFFPGIHQLIDWGKTPESLDKELQRITALSKTKRRFADKLYKVWLVSGEEIWVLIHIEIQSQYEEEFQKRMYIYNYRAFDLYQKPVISLAILGDEKADWKPESYNYSLGGCEVSLKFPVVKLLSYEEKWSELEESNNPFAIVVMAHLKTKATKGKPEEREKWKWILIRGLYNGGLDRNQIVRLLGIIDTMMKLPKKSQESLENKIKNFEEETKMPLLTNIELKGIETGKEIGKEIGTLEKAHDYVKLVLKTRLGDIPETIAKEVDTISVLPILDELLKLAIKVDCFEDFHQSLLKLSPKKFESNESDKS